MAQSTAYLQNGVDDAVQLRVLVDEHQPIGHPLVANVDSTAPDPLPHLLLYTHTHTHTRVKPPYTCNGNRTRDLTFIV